MSAQIIDGKALSAKVRGEIKAQAEAFECEQGRKIGLSVIRVGNDPASTIYVNNKIKGCEETGIKSFSYILPEETTFLDLTDLIQTLNEDKNVNGILVQLPLPPHLNEREVLSYISPDKDVDGFHSINAGRLFLGENALTACTPSGCIELIKSTGVEIAGKHAVVIGRSNIVGKPAAMLLLNENATVTVCHSKTKNIKEITRQADILIAAVGRREFVTGDMVKPGAIVIDVGINREDKLYGDVNFPECVKVAGYITPVPGGVGPMTITMLLKNTIKAAMLQI